MLLLAWQSCKLHCFLYIQAPHCNKCPNSSLVISFDSEGLAGFCVLENKLVLG